MTDDKPPDTLTALAVAAAQVVASGHDAAELRDLANRLAADERLATRAGRLLGLALDDLAHGRR